jgi:amino acid transporter
VTVGTGSYVARGSVAPFAALLGTVLGPYGAAGTAILAVVIGFGVVNAYVTGRSRLVYAAAMDGAFPQVLGHVDPRTRVPQWSMLALLRAVSIGFAIYYFANVSLATALLVASGAAIPVYVVGPAAGVRLHGRSGRAGRAGRWRVAISLAVSLRVLPFVGLPRLVVGLVVVAALAYDAMVRPSAGPSGGAG